MENKKCKYYCGIGECTHRDDINEPGECIYNDAIIRENAAIHCSIGRKELETKTN